MKIYGAEFSEGIPIEQVEGLPTWTSTDIGRILYSMRYDTYFFGTKYGWYSLNQGDVTINNMLKFGETGSTGGTGGTGRRGYHGSTGATGGSGGTGATGETGGSGGTGGTGASLTGGSGGTGYIGGTGGTGGPGTGGSGHTGGSGEPGGSFALLGDGSYETRMNVINITFRGTHDPDMIEVEVEAEYNGFSVPSTLVTKSDIQNNIYYEKEKTFVMIYPSIIFPYRCRSIISTIEYNNSGKEVLITSNNYFEFRFFNSIFGQILDLSTIFTNGVEIKIKSMYISSQLVDVDFEVDVEVPYREQEITFTDTTFPTSDMIGQEFTYLWDFGDGNTSYHKEPKHTYMTSGVYDVSLTVVISGDAFYKRKYSYMNITCKELIVDFTASIESGPYPLSVSFNNLSSGDITSYVWDFGNNSKSGEENPTVVYTKEGKYTVILEVTDDCGNVEYLTKSSFIEVTKADPVANFRISPITGFTPLTSICEDISFGDVNNRYWDLDILPEYVGNIVEHITYTDPGTYIISLQVSNWEGILMPTKRMQEIIVYDFDFSCNQSIIDNGQVVDFNITTFGFNVNDVIIYWDFGDGNTSSESSPSHRYLYGIGVKDFNVSLTIVASWGTKVVTKENFITVRNDYPNPRIIIAEIGNVGLPITYDCDLESLDGRIITSYMWTFDDGLISNSRTGQITYTESGNKDISLTINTTDGSKYYRYLSNKITVYGELPPEVEEPEAPGVVCLSNTDLGQKSGSSVTVYNLIQGDNSINPSPTNIFQTLSIDSYANVGLKVEAPFEISNIDWFTHSRSEVYDLNPICWFRLWDVGYKTIDITVMGVNGEVVNTSYTILITDGEIGPYANCPTLAQINVHDYSTELGEYIYVHNPPNEIDIDHLLNLRVTANFEVNSIVWTVFNEKSITNALDYSIFIKWKTLGYKTVDVRIEGYHGEVATDSYSLYITDEYRGPLPTAPDKIQINMHDYLTKEYIPSPPMSWPFTNHIFNFRVTADFEVATILWTATNTQSLSFQDRDSMYIRWNTPGYKTVNVVVTGRNGEYESGSYSITLI